MRGAEFFFLIIVLKVFNKDVKVMVSSQKYNLIFHSLKGKIFFMVPNCFGEI